MTVPRLLNLPFRVVATLALGAVLLACTPLEPPVSATYPRPERVADLPPARPERAAPSTVSAPQPTKPRVAVGDPVARATFKVEHTDLSEATARSVVTRLLDDLVRDFGPPAVTDRPMAVLIDPELPKHATVRVTPGRREVRLSSLNFVESEHHFVVHELFHAYFQTDAFLNLPISTYEGWAAYAQYRYLYRGRSNPEIIAILLRDAGLPPDHCRHHRNSDASWKRNLMTSSRAAYVSASCHIFGRPHDRNRFYFAAYRDLETSPSIAPGVLEVLCGADRRVLDQWEGERRTLAELQYCLRSEGDYPGAIDGLTGPQTQSAIHAFLARHDLSPRSHGGVLKAVVRTRLAGYING